MYDYGARNYDPALGRWMNIDPLAEANPNKSIYNFCSDNPINRTDPTGMLDGDIYNLQGEHIGNDGNNDQKVYLNQTFDNTQLTEKQSKNLIQNINNPFSSAMVSEVNITNDELNTRAFLTTITTLEGGAYNKRIGGDTFEGNEHPGGRTLRFGKVYKYTSPAGAYQITEGTYKGLKNQDSSILDFSPTNQDKMAIDIIDNSGALGDVRNGNLDSAINKLTLQWSSLPGGVEETRDNSGTKSVFKQNIVREIFNKSNLATPQGQLDCYNR